jgi:cytochrome c
MPRGATPNHSPTLPLLLALATLVVVVAGVVAAQQDPRTAPAGAHGDLDPRDRGMEGWYTEEQADRGREAYGRYCAECHSPDLRARSTYISLYAYPALTGAYFWDRWGGQTAHALLLVIQETMPLHAPGSLNGDTYADITAHVLRENGFVPGPRDLPAAMDGAERLVAMPIEPSYVRPLARAQAVGAERAEAVRAEAERERFESPDASEPDVPEEAEEPAGAHEPGAAADADAAADAEEPAGEEEPADADPEAEAAVRERWFSEAQVQRGRELYQVGCTRCHGGALQGIGVAPSLAGDNFMERWDGESVADLFWVVHQLMPLDDQGTLSSAAAAALVAYILAQNGFEAGVIELPQHEARLEPFVIARQEE